MNILKRNICLLLVVMLIIKLIPLKNISACDNNVTSDKGGIKTAICEVYDEENKNTAENTKLEDKLNVTITSQNYYTISKISKEKLACAPSLVSLGDTKFAVSYLADETNSVETEASTTISCRLAIFDTENLENIQFYDIARANQVIGNITIGNKAPYEPNLIQIDEFTLLVLFNIRDIKGDYVYYSAIFDLNKKEVTSYHPLTLDGNNWNPKNIATSYNKISSIDIDSSGPTNSMVFTSRIIKKDGYYYGYCGGISNMFGGILVRSDDGINWTSVLVPTAVEEMKGIIECGFEFMDNYVYLCLRDISSGVYHCVFDYDSRMQITDTKKLYGITTSKPVAFINENEVYLIVNKETGDDNSIGRRNTALIYKVDPSTCSIELVKSIFCKDGIAYHSVVDVDGKNYWAFHTDSRRINPYTQGRSNLAFLEIPKFYQFDDDQFLEFRDYEFVYSSGCITGSTNTWQTPAVNYHYQIPLSYFEEYNYVTIKANDIHQSYVSFFTEIMSKPGEIKYAKGHSKQVVLEPKTQITFEIPNDAKYLYILNNNAKMENLLPSQVVFHGVLGDVNNDGLVNAKDRMELTRYLARWVGYESIDLKNADINLDGSVNPQDRMILSRYFAKMQGYERLPHLK